MRRPEAPAEPGAATPRGGWRQLLPREWSLETRVAANALLIGAPASGVLLVALALQPAVPLRWLLAGLAVCALAASLLLVRRLRRQVVYPLYTLSNLLGALREGDYTLRGAPARRGDLFGEVFRELNALSDTLHVQRLQVEEKNALLTKVVAAIDMAIFAFDASRRIQLANPAAARLLARPVDELIGLDAATVGLDDCLDGTELHAIERRFAGATGRWEVRRARFREGGLPHDLLVIADLSRTLREEERLAWQRLLRVLGHELNNSLAPIRSMADTLLKLLGTDEPPADWRDDARIGLAVIGDRAESLSRFMTRYTTLARLPPPNVRPVRLGDLVRRIARLDQRMAVTLEAGHEVIVDADADQLELALINLLRNAVEASLPHGGAVLIRWCVQGGEVTIEIVDDGAGLPDSGNLFVPFFTTKTDGSGIGLVLARQIVEAHRGSLDLRDRTDRSGCIARICLPAAANGG